MKIFRDPIHNVIDLNTGDKNIDKLIIKLIDSKEFQRLRFIRQLGFSYLAYPSATHTRFEHSLGTAFLAKRFLDKIISMENTILATAHYNDQFKEMLSDFFMQIKIDKPLTIVAALLHDIGHGPLSHVTEEVITGIKHEDWVRQIILGKTDVNKLLANCNQSYPQIICDMLIGTNTDRPSAKILAGQLDVDRIDYLLRDSHMTGSGYGKFDVEWLINVLTVGFVKNEKTGKSQVEIGLDYGKGLSVAEDFVMARTYMFKNVYLHKTTLIAQNMLSLLFERIKELPSEDTKESLHKIIFDNCKNTEELLDDYLNISDIDLYYFLKSLQSSADEVVKNLSYKILNRQLFKKINNPTAVKELMIKEKGEDIAKYYITHVVTKKKTLNIHPKDDVLLFDKSGISRGISEYFNIQSHEDGYDLGYYVDQEVL